MQAPLSQIDRRGQIPLDSTEALCHSAKPSQRLLELRITDVGAVAVQPGSLLSISCTTASVRDSACRGCRPPSFRLGRSRLTSISRQLADQSSRRLRDQATAEYFLKRGEWSEDCSMLSRSELKRIVLVYLLRNVRVFAPLVVHGCAKNAHDWSVRLSYTVQISRTD